MSPEKRPQPQPSRNSASRSRPANRGPKHRLGRNLMALALLLGLLGIGWKALAYFGFVPEGGDGGRIIALHPEVRQKSDQLVAQAAKKGIEVVITSDFRGVEEQNELYRQGREKPGNIVTNARGGQSYHNFGLAIDFALRDESDRIVWDMELDRSGNGRSDWKEVVELAKDLGFEWGGDWSNFPDYPHLQITFGYTLRQLQNGKYPAGSAVERKQPEPNSSD